MPPQLSSKIKQADTTATHGADWTMSALFTMTAQ
jgi:hypothetical protein